MGAPAPGRVTLLIDGDDGTYRAHEITAALPMQTGYPARLHIRGTLPLFV